MLAEVQSRLEEHFAGLTQRRLSRGYPVFALEHGLSTDEIAALGRALAEDLAAARMVRPRYWLPWIVYAAEVGYTYDGDEYWTSFRNRMADWSRFGDRDAVRELFVRFGAKFSGFVPQGRFAEHFTIIAWPIAHAILPQDLQLRFARHLHEVRYELAKGIDDGIPAIAEVLAENRLEGSSRYQNLLQQTDLLAHVILALRDRDIDDAECPIYKPTLSRIVDDIERRKVGARWLRETTRILRESRTNISVDLRKPKRGDVIGDSRMIQSGVKLVAQRGSNGQWSLGMALPDVQYFIRLGGFDPKLLEATRISTFDAADRWRPGRALLAMSKRELPISRLPPYPKVPLVRSENASPLDDLFSGVFCIIGEPPWLLRVQDDGIARQVLGKHVRAGEQYVIVAAADLDDKIVRDIDAVKGESAIGDARFYVFETGGRISDLQLEALSRAQLGFSVRVRIDPLGLVPRFDPSTGCAVWLPEEEVMVRISADHELTEIGVSVDEKESLTIPLRGNKEAIVSAGKLPLGRHKISVRTFSAHGSRNVDAETLLIEVRPPMPWQTSIRTTAGFRAMVLPFGARFEQLLDGRASVSIVGPPERTVHVEAVARDPNGHESEILDLGNVRLPADREAVRRVLAHLKDEHVSDAVMSSPHVDLRFRIEELGAMSIGFSHAVQPLRWKREIVHGTQKARLVDEAGKNAEVRIDRYDVSTPDKAVTLDRSECASGIDVSYPASMFAVRFASKWTSTLIGSATVGRRASLSDIGTQIRIGVQDPRKLPRLLSLYHLWRICRPIGPLAPIRKARVLEVFEERIAMLACGERWARRAHSFCAGQADEDSVVAMQREVGGSAGFAARVRELDWQQYGAKRDVLGSEFARYAQTYNVCGDAGLCRFMLDLAFDPARILINPASNAFAEIERNGVLARAAFFAKLMAGMAARTPQPAEQEIP